MGKWKEEAEGLEVVLRVVDRHGMVELEVHSWAAWGHRMDLLSSSATAGSGSPPQTCRSWWWT